MLLAALFTLLGCLIVPLAAKLVAVVGDSSRVVRIAAPRHELVESTLSPYGPGFEQELLASFARGAGYNIEWLDVKDAGEAWQALSNGDADMVVGVASPPVGFEDSGVTAGPAYAHYKPMLVHPTKRHGLRQDTELCGAPVLLAGEPVLAQRLVAATASLECGPGFAVGEGTGMGLVLNALAGDEARFGLVDANRFRLWQPFFSNVRPTRALGEEISYRWYWRKDKAGFAQAMDSFWQYQQTDNRLRELSEKYFGFLPAKTDYYELYHLFRTIREVYPLYRDVILDEAAAKGLDPLLLIALIYQESRFDPVARSRTGVRGLLQITTATAEGLDLEDRLNPVESIRAGSRYLISLWERLEKYDLEPWDRWCFALAAYNRGFGHVRDAMELSKEQGGTGRSWSQIKKVFPLLAYERYYSRATYGYTRGHEAVAYVDKVRYYYYILRGLVVLSRPEAEYLGPVPKVFAGRPSV